MHEIIGVVVAAVADRLLEGIERQVRPQGRRRPPSNDSPREDVDDERDVDETSPGRDLREIGDPVCVLIQESRRPTFAPEHGARRPFAAHPDPEDRAPRPEL
jgi:hypothetical protein